MSTATVRLYNDALILMLTPASQSAHNDNADVAQVYRANTREKDSSTESLECSYLSENLDTLLEQKEKSVGH